MAGIDGATIQLRGVIVGLALFVSLVSFSGCVSQVASNILPSPFTEQLNAPVRIVTEAATTVGDDSQEEPFDPFAKPGEAGLEEYDPLEPFNTRVFEFNRQVDRWVLKPVAKGFNFIVPDQVQAGIGNFIYNTRFVPRFCNNIFQGKFRGAGIEAGRFLMNTTVGLAGFVDVASRFDLKTPEEDAGQTLGFYGVKPGPYLVLPFVQPFTVRDLVGYAADIFLNPIYWMVLPVIEIAEIPSAIPHGSALTTGILFTAKVTEVVNERSLNLENYEGVEESTVDLYSAVRNAYLQKRARAIQE